MRGVGRALGGRWEGAGRALGGHWEGVWLASGEGRPGSLIYRQIKSLHCSGYLLVINILIILIVSSSHLTTIIRSNSIVIEMESNVKDYRTDSCYVSFFKSLHIIFKYI